MILLAPCSWCGRDQPPERERCRNCGHEPHKPRSRCTCGQAGCLTERPQRDAEHRLRLPGRD